MYEPRWGGDREVYLKMLAGIITFCAVLVIPAASWAAHPLVTDDTGTQGTEKYQLEASGTWLTDKKNEGGEGVRELNSIATVVFTAGIAETMDVMVTVPYVWTDTRESGTNKGNHGLFDTAIEAKWRFFGKQKLSLAIKPGIIIPTGDADKGLGSGHVDYSASLISTVDAEPWSFDVNLGLSVSPELIGESHQYMARFACQSICNG